jgi:hypothetical protein
MECFSGLMLERVLLQKGFAVGGIVRLVRYFDVPNICKES